MGFKWIKIPLPDCSVSTHLFQHKTQVMNNKQKSFASYRDWNQNPVGMKMLLPRLPDLITTGLTIQRPVLCRVTMLIFSCGLCGRECSMWSVCAAQRWQQATSQRRSLSVTAGWFPSGPLSCTATVSPKCQPASLSQSCVSRFEFFAFQLAQVPLA